MTDRPGYKWRVWLRHNVEDRVKSPGSPPATYVHTRRMKLEAWTCERCGALVVDTDAHDAFHAAPDTEGEGQ